MKYLAILLALPMMASAQGFAPMRMSDPGDTCYTWTGGNFSAGSFSKCQPTIVIAAAPAPLSAPPVASPVMVPMQSCPPPPPKATRHLIKKKPKIQC